MSSDNDLRLAKSFYFTAIDGVASFPEVMVAIRQAVADPAATPSSIGRAVERDVAFASRLLRIVNAPAVGLIRPCASIPHAVTLVGHERIGMTAEKVASLAALSQCAAVAPELAARAAREAAVARAIAMTVGVSPEHAFTAALLANVGAVAILVTQPGWLDAELTIEDERARLGFDHAELGGDILQRWNLPAPIPDAVRLSHDLYEAHQGSGDVLRLVAVLQTAELLAPRLAADAEPQVDEWEDLAEHPALEVLGIDAVKLAMMWLDLEKSTKEEASPAPPYAHADELRAQREARLQKKRQPRSFYVAMFAAIAIPAAVGFELFLRL